MHTKHNIWAVQNVLHTYSVEGCEFHISGFQYPHATRYTKSFCLPVSLDAVTRRGRPKSRLVFFGMAGANVEFGNGLPGPSRQANFLLLCNTSVL